MPINDSNIIDEQFEKVDNRQNQYDKLQLEKYSSIG